MIKKIVFNVLNALGGILLMSLCQYAGTFVASMVKDELLNALVYAVVYVILFVLLGTLYAKKVLKMTTNELGISVKNINPILFAIGFGLPVVVLLLYAFVIPGQIINNNDRSVVFAFVKGLLKVGLPAGIGEELLFRGLIMRYMKKSFGTVIAVVIPAVVFALLHIGNMTSFSITTLVLLILAGASVSVLFSMMALKSGSLIPGMVAHAIWNTLIIGDLFGIGAIVNGVPNSALICIMPNTTNEFITGGEFGVEAAIICSAVYLFAAFLVGFTKSKNPKTAEE